MIQYNIDHLQFAMLRDWLLRHGYLSKNLGNQEIRERLKLCKPLLKATKGVKNSLIIEQQAFKLALSKIEAERAAKGKPPILRSKTISSFSSSFPTKLSPPKANTISALTKSDAPAASASQSSPSSQAPSQ